MKHIINRLQKHFEANSFMPISASPSDVEKLKNPSISKPRRLAEDLFGILASKLNL